MKEAKYPVVKIGLSFAEPKVPGEVICFCQTLNTQGPNLPSNNS